MSAIQVKWPRATPTPMQTCHGATMTEASARFYGWLRDCGVAIHSWSTDACVESNLPKLRALATWLDGAIGRAGPAGAATRPQLIAMRYQLRCVMGRRPSARVTGQRR